ncbi:MAG: gamma-glutamyltransferase family protein [Terracidiphilus sp.]
MTRNASSRDFLIVEGREVVCDEGAVATGPAAAARIGAEILAEGGNAFDAAAAASLACAVLEPQSVDLGGYILCAVVRKAGESEAWTLDANAIAPRRAGEAMFAVTPAELGHAGVNEAEYQCSVRGNPNIIGPLSVAVPGFMAGVGTLCERWGRLSWPEIVAPCQRLVADGFPYGPTAAAIERQLPFLKPFEPTCRHLMPNGTVPARNDIWHRPDLEKTLARLSAYGWQDFYSGEVGRGIGQYVTAIGGILGIDDMAAYAPRVEPALRTTYRGNTVFASSLPAGGLTTLQILNFLDCLPASIALDTPEYWHRLGEVMRMAWQDRIRYLADPDFCDIPVERLVAKNYAMGRTETLRQFPASIAPQEAPGLPAPPGTIHVSAADGEGNLVAATLSQGQAFGSCVTVPGTGVILGHGMSRLDPRPGRANSIAAGKRPLSNVSPLIVSLPERDIAVGTRGGRPIINVCAQLAHRIIDGALTPAQALPMPRLSVCDREPLELLKFDFTETVPNTILEKLTAMGHQAIRKKETIECLGAAHCAEFLKRDARVRAAGDAWAAGVNASLAGEAG